MSQKKNIKSSHRMMKILQKRQNQKLMQELELKTMVNPMQLVQAYKKEEEENRQHGCKSM